MDENLFDARVEINLVNYSQVSLEQRLLEHKVFVVVQRRPIKIYVVCKYFRQEDIVVNKALTEIALYLSEPPDNPQFISFSSRQLSELADYCKFEKIIMETVETTNFAKYSASLALAQKLEAMNVCSLGRRLVQTEQRYEHLSERVSEHMDGILEHEQRLMETHDEIMSVVRKHASRSDVSG